MQSEAICALVRSCVRKTTECLRHSANILNYMVNGVNGRTMKVGEAVDQVNTDLRNARADVNGKPITEQFTIVGDGNVEIDP
jgi:hypothetical protein